MKETLRQIWEGKGYSLASAAREANVSTNTLAKMNKEGYQSVRGDVVGRVCHALGISQEYLRDHVETEK